MTIPYHADRERTCPHLRLTNAPPGKVVQCARCGKPFGLTWTEEMFGWEHKEAPSKGPRPTSLFEGLSVPSKLYLVGFAVAFEVIVFGLQGVGVPPFKGQRWTPLWGLFEKLRKEEKP